MNPDQLSLLKKFAISTLLAATLFSVETIVLPTEDNNPFELQFSIPIVLGSILVFVLYFDGLRGFSRKPGWRQGGTFYAGLVYFSAMLLVPGLGIKLTDVLTHGVTTIPNAARLPDPLPEYFAFNDIHPVKSAALTDRDIKREFESSRSVPHLKLTLTVYVPLEESTANTAYRCWVKFGLLKTHSFKVTDEEKEKWAAEVSDNFSHWIDSLDFRTINHFKAVKTDYRSLPDHSGNVSGDVFILEPAFESLAMEAKDDFLNFIGLYVAFLVSFLVFILPLYKPTRVKAQADSSS